MANELIIRVSKKRTVNNNFSFNFDTNLPSNAHSVQLPESGILPETESVEREVIEQQVKSTLDVIFCLAKSHFNATGAMRFKLLFSDKYVGTGLIAVGEQRIETHREISIPMLGTEASFIFCCMPNRC